MSSSGRFRIFFYCDIVPLRQEIKRGGSLFPVFFRPIPCKTEVKYAYRGIGFDTFNPTEEIMPRRILIAMLTGALLLCATAAFAKKQSPAVNAISAEYAKGVQCINHRQWNDGIASMTKVIDNPATPKDMLPFALNNRGSAYANKKMTTEALADLTKAIELNPDYTAAYYDRARILAMQNKHAEAVADLTKAIERSKPSKAQAIYYKNRGLSYGAMTKLDEAKADFKKAKELDPKIKIPTHYKPLLKQ